MPHTHKELNQTNGCAWAGKQLIPCTYIYIVAGKKKSMQQSQNPKKFHTEQAEGICSLHILCWLNPIHKWSHDHWSEREQSLQWHIFKVRRCHTQLYRLHTKHKYWKYLCCWRHSLSNYQQSIEECSVYMTLCTLLIYSETICNSIIIWWPTYLPYLCC